MLTQIWLDRAICSLQKFEKLLIDSRLLTMQNYGLKDTFLQMQSEEKAFLCSSRVTDVIVLKRRPKGQETEMMPA
jgi:hypothetical protein